MPIYEYRCEACGERVEHIQKIADPPLTRCPACGQESLRRLVSAPSFQFKGSGWYVTDYARSKEKGGEASPSSESSSEEGSKAPAASEKGDGGKAAATDAGPAKAPKASSSD